MRDSENPKDLKGRQADAKFNGIKSIGENLYEKAKTMDELEFVELCDKVILGQKIIVRKVSEDHRHRKWS